MILIAALDFLIAALLSVIVIAIIGVAFFYDYNDECYYEKQGERFLFYCNKCNNIYYSSKYNDVSECTKCRAKNIRLKF